MGINRIFETLSKIDSGNQEKTLPKAATPPFVSTASETNAAEKRSNQQSYGDYRRSQIESRWAAQTQDRRLNPSFPKFPKLNTRPPMSSVYSAMALLTVKLIIGSILFLFVKASCPMPQMLATARGCRLVFFNGRKSREDLAS